MSIPSAFIDRYRSIAPKGFVAALENGLPKTIRVNTLKSEVEDFQTRATEHNWELDQLPWLPTGFAIERADRSTPLGHSLEHFTGQMYIQEASSMIPPVVLDPQAGETVLDMAAAPGSKTTQLAAMMANQGLLVANDSSVPRLKALSANLERCGTLNTVVTQLSGARLGRFLPEYFDRILLDAPCTAEGTAAKNPELWGRWSENAIDKLSILQSRLLAGAYNALKPGGILVYSTCTFAPEENEGVIHAFLANHPEVEVVPFDLPGLQLAPGVDQWHDQTFDSRVANTRRVWPGENPMEGFFIAKLRKPDGSVEEQQLREFNDRRYQDGPEDPTDWLADWFGMPGGWADGLTWRNRDQEQWLMTPEAAAFNALPTIRRGLRISRTVRSGYKPTTDFIQLFGSQITKRQLEIDDEQTAASLAGTDLPIEADPGYLSLIHNGIPFACGLGLPGKVKNQLRVSRRILPR